MTRIGPSITRRRRSGFTLIELVLVLTIIALLMGAGIYYLSGNIEVAQETRVQGDLGAIATQLQVYQARNLRMPTTEQGIKALVEKPTSEPIPDRWSKLLDEEIIDPWGNPYQYKNPGQRSFRPFDLFSMGPDGQPETEDDLVYRPR